MKILQIYDLNPAESIGGVEHVIFQLSKELVNLGHEVTILTGAGESSSQVTKDGVNVLNFDLLGTMKMTYSSGRITPLRQLLFLFSILAGGPDLKFDIYHGHIYSSGLIASYFARKNNGIAVNTIHGSYYPVWDKLTTPINAILYRMAEKRLATFLAKHSHLQLHVSTYFADQVSEWGGKVKVIPNGVDETLFYPGVKNNSTNSLPVLLTARRLVKKNGVEYLIKAMEYLKNECELFIIGDGPERQKLEALGDRIGNITFLGAVSYEDMANHIRKADIAVVPSIIEASSLFMLEAMASGKPVIATTAGGLPEILKGAGILVPPMSTKGLVNAIRELIRDTGKQIELGKKARIEVEKKYTWKIIAGQVENEYQRLRSEQNA